MKRILLNLILLFACEFVFSQSAIFDPADPIINYNAGAALGTSTHPSIPAGGQMVKWVRTPKVAGFPSGSPGISWNTSNYKCYMVGSLPFRLRFPNGYVPGANDGKKFPIMIFWHGGGEAEGQYNQVPGSNPPQYTYQAYGNGVYDNEYQLYQGAQAFENKTINDQDAFILFPQSPIVGFDNTQFSAMNIVIDELVRSCKGDQDRVISMGLSIGGKNCVEYALLYPQRVSSVISSSGIELSSFSQSMQPALHIPLWIGNGGKDVKPDSATIADFVAGYKSSGGVLQWSYLPLQGHVMWDYQWALEPNFDSVWSTAHKANPLVYNDNRFFCPGSPVSATMGITPGFFAYQWDKDGSGVPIPGANSSNYTATSLGNYRARFQRTSSSGWSDWSLAPAKIVAVCPPVVGTGVGLNGNYYNTLDLSGTAINRVDPSMNFYIENNASPLSGINGGNYSVRWTGQIQAQFTETYTITTLSDDGIRLWINGVQLINNWTDHGGTENSGTFAFVAGQKYDIKIEYYNKANNNNVYNNINNSNTGISALKWSSPSTVKQMVPKTQLYPNGTGDPTIPGCVTNILPANGTTIATGSTASLTWNSTNATTYDLYLYTGATPPGTPTVTGITSNAYSATGLLASTLYNWFVVPKNAAGAPSGCVANKTTFTTAGGLPACVINTTPGNGSTLGTQTTATLTWPIAATATSYDVYLWTGATPPASPTTNVSTTSYNATGLLAGTLYNWYIAPRNASGANAGCAAGNTTAFTTAAAVIPVPGCTVNSTPANGSTLGSQTKATFSWAAAANATSYDLYVWTGATPPATPTRNVSGTSYDTLGLNAGTTYKFYVAPRNGSGAAAGCAASNTTTFSTASVPVVPFPLPVCVANTAPVNNSTLSTQTTATLSWNSGATTTKKLVIIGSSTSACVGLDPATQCYVGLLSSFYNKSAPQDTTVISLGIGGTNVYNGMPSSYVTPYPANGAYFAPTSGANITAALAQNPDAVLVNYPSNSYDTLSVGEIMYCLRTIRDSANRKGVPCFITTTQPRTSGPDFFTSAVKLKLAVLKDSILAQFGNYAIDFYTGLINPADSSILYDQGDATHMNATGHAILAQRVEAKNVFSPALNPSAVTSYDLYMWTGATPPASPTRNVATTTIDTTGLTAGTAYKFYVAPRSTSGAATGCAAANTFTFNTAILTAPACVTNTAPLNAAVLGTQTTATLTWPSSATATSYDVYLWTGATPPASPTANVATTTYSATALLAGTTYSWYIAPKNASGANTTCATTNKTTFTTASVAPPACVINTAPANGSLLGTQTTATLTWPSAATATSYDVYLWTGATPPASPTASVGTTSYNATALLPGTMYNWYIAPRNAGGPATTCGATNATVFTTASAVIPVPSCVTNTAPVNAAVLGTQTTATLTWPSSATATSYDVYLWTGATPPASPTANVTGTTYGATALLPGTLYNWYIAPSNGSGANTTCAAGNTTTFTTASVPVPLCVTNTSPANAALLGTQTTATLTWPSSATAVSYDVYLWTGATPPASPTANVATTSYSTTTLNPGTLYNWYIAPRNAGGAATTCAAANTTSFTTASSVTPPPACAINNTPANNATVLGQNTATLAWGAVATATSYDVYVWTGAIAPSVPSANVATTSYAATGLLPSTPYNWYIAPRNAGGAATGCGTTSATSFTTAAIPCVVNTSPANAAVLGTQTTATLTWPAEATATSYDVYLWTGATPPASPTANVTATSYSATTLLANTLYNWYIAPRNAGGAATACGATNATTFTTAAIPVPACVVNTAPVSGTLLGTQTTATLTWPSSPTAVSYDVYLWTGATPPASPTINVSSPTYSAASLLPGTQYSWYIAPRNASGANATCAAGNTTTFTTAAIPVPACVTNTAPVNGTLLGTQTTATLTWPSSPTATSYDVYLWTGATPPASPTANVSSPTYSAALLSPGTLYNWYIAPRNASGANATCGATNATVFTTAAAVVAVPSCVINTAPVNGTLLGTQTTATLTWPSAATATSYDVYLWTGATPPASPTVNVSSPTYNATSLLPGTLYNWYIAPRNSGGANTTCAAGNTTTFTTASIPVPVCVTNTSPANAAVLGTQTTATLTWPSSPTAVSYDVYLWTGATPPASPTVNVTSPTYSAASLLPGTQYNWYIAPRNASGANATCAAGNTTVFTTAAASVVVPSCVVNTSPANGTTVAAQTSATLTWPSASGATSYDVYVWTGATPPASPTANVTTTTYIANTLVAGTVYSWYIAPRNSAGAATGCSTSNKTTFTTASGAAGTGLQGAYYSGTALAGTPLLTRIDPTINFDLPTASPAPGVVPNDNYSVRWTGQVKAIYSETYTFYTVADDGIRMWVNGVQLVDNWVNQGATEKSGTITLVAGQKYDVVIEYYEAAGFAFTQFLWSSASTPKAVVPQAQLYPPVGGGALVADAGAGLRVADNTTATASVTASIASVSSVTSSLPTISSTVNPNPVATGQTVKVQITSDKPGAAAINIVNINGLIITTQKVNLVAGINTTTVNTASLGQGFYIVNITGGITPLNMKLLVQ